MQHWEGRRGQPPAVEGGGRRAEGSGRRAEGGRRRAAGGGRSAAPAVVGALRLDAAALGALVDHLPGLQLQALHVLFRCIPFGYCPLQLIRRMYFSWGEGNIF